VGSFVVVLANGKPENENTAMILSSALQEKMRAEKMFIVRRGFCFPRPIPETKAGEQRVRPIVCLKFTTEGYLCIQFVSALLKYDAI
jgi:hypothetical protein